MTEMFILSLLEITGYALSDIIDLKRSGDVISYSCLIGDAIKKYGDARNADLSVLVDRITPDVAAKVKKAVSSKLENALHKKRSTLQKEVEEDLANFFQKEADDEDFSNLCANLIVGLHSYSDNKDNYPEYKDKESKTELQELGVF